MFSHLVTAETAWPGSMVCDAKGISAIVNGHTACQPELARKVQFWSYVRICLTNNQMWYWLLTSSKMFGY